MGVVAKSINETIESNANGFAWDAGVVSAPFLGKHLTAGFVTSNNGTLKFKEETFDLPATRKLGLAWKDRAWLADLDWVSPKNDSSYVALGGEYRRPLSSTISAALRGGYNTRSTSALGATSGMTTGLGMSFKGMSLDYAFSPMGDLGATHRLSFSFDNDQFYGESLQSFFSNVTDVGASFSGGPVKFSDKATSEKIGKSGTYFAFGMDSLWRRWIPFNMGITFFQLKDENPFTQATTGGVKSSSLDAMGGYVETGVRVKKESPITAGVNVGYMYMSDPSRSIANCSDCNTESISVGGGQLYFAPLIGFSINSFSMLASYRIFDGSGAIESQLDFHLAWLVHFDSFDSAENRKRGR